jgi:hypothetical protein
MSNSGTVFPYGELKHKLGVGKFLTRNVNKGQALVEHALVLALITVVAILAVKATGQKRPQKGNT